MGWGDFVEKHVRDELIRQGFTVAVAQGGAYEARKHYDRMSQASKRGNIYDDALRHGRLWAEKQTSTAERREAKRTVKKGGNQAGLF
ncbi:hypothetical protein [Phytobacter diazotrophicus]|uniref:hypothetical protein n=1 Tax=Phytobacter diazotrophicus TaxID=395631 RepID=UPI002FFA4489